MTTPCEGLFEGVSNYKCGGDRRFPFSPQPTESTVRMRLGVGDPKNRHNKSCGNGLPLLSQAIASSPQQPTPSVRMRLENPKNRRDRFCGNGLPLSHAIATFPQPPTPTVRMRPGEPENQSKRRKVVVSPTRHGQFGQRNSKNHRSGDTDLSVSGRPATSSATKRRCDSDNHRFQANVPAKRQSTARESEKQVVCDGHATFTKHHDCHSPTSVGFQQSIKSRTKRTHASRVKSPITAPPWVAALVERMRNEGMLRIPSASRLFDNQTSSSGDHADQTTQTVVPRRKKTEDNAAK